MQPSQTPRPEGQAQPRIVAALAWFDEPPEFLHRTVESLSGIADHLVAFDGRWDAMPGEATNSSLEQGLALRDAALNAGVTLELRTSEDREPWPSQVAKRDALMVHAGELGDWVLVIDGDECLEACDIAAARAALATTDLDVAEITLRTLNRPWPYRHLAPMAAPTRRIYRAGTRVPGPAHNDYALDGRRLNGDPARGPLELTLDLTGSVTVAHDNRNRGHDRNAAAEAYRLERRRTGIEVAA